LDTEEEIERKGAKKERNRKTRIEREEQEIGGTKNILLFITLTIITK